MDILGLPLSRALELLDTTPTIVETAPPFAPKNRVPIWGEARVLRVVERKNGLELLVAREMLGEQTPADSP